MSELPAGWTTALVDDIAFVVRGVTYRKPQSSTVPASGLVPILRATNIVDDELVFTDLVFVPREAVASDQFLRVGDVVVAASSGSASVVGKSAALKSPWEGAFGAFCAVLRPHRGGVEPGYLANYVASKRVRRRWSAAAAGTNINNLKAGDVRATQMPVPPLAEQRRIVAAIEEHFSRLDAAERSLDQAAQRLAVLTDQAVDSAFAGSWPRTTLGEIADIVGGVTKDAKRQSDPAYVEVPYLRVANVQRGRLDLSKVATIRVPPAKAEQLELKPGDVLFNEGGDRDKLGRGWVWNGEIDRCIHQNHVFRARLRNDFEPKFVSWHGNTHGRRWFEERGRQTTNLASLNLTTLKAFPVPVPPLDEQQRIVAEVEQQLSLIDSLAGAIETAKRRSAALRRAILERAFRGELVPRDPADEPASVMLERIAAERAAEPPRPRRRAARARR